MKVMIVKPSTHPTATPTPTAWIVTTPHKKSKRVPQGLNQPHPQGLLVFQDGDGKRGDPVNEASGAIHSTKISGNFAPKLNGSVRSNRKSFEKTGPSFQVDHFSRSDRLEFWLNGSRTSSQACRGAFYSTQKSGNFGWFIKWNGPFRFGPTGIFGTSFEGGPL